MTDLPEDILYVDPQQSEHVWFSIPSDGDVPFIRGELVCRMLNEIRLLQMEKYRTTVRTTELLNDPAIQKVASEVGAEVAKDQEYIEVKKPNDLNDLREKVTLRR